MNVRVNFEFDLLHHVGVVAKRVRAAAAHEGDDNTPSGVKNNIRVLRALLIVFATMPPPIITYYSGLDTNGCLIPRTTYFGWSGWGQVQITERGLLVKCYNLHRSKFDKW